MGNIRIKLANDKKINNVNKYADIDVTSENITSTLYDRQAIRNSIRNILSWKPYERILNPDFGNSLWKLVFENMTTMSQQNIKDMVRKMLSYEKRISIKSINVQMNISNNEIFVDFSYSIPTLNNEEDSYSIAISNG